MNTALREESAEQRIDLLEWLDAGIQAAEQLMEKSRMTEPYHWMAKTRRDTLKEVVDQLRGAS